MNHDFSKDPKSPQAEAFKAWLLSETISAFHAAKHDPDRQKAAVAQFAERACEAHMADNDVSQVISNAAAQGRLTDAEEDIAYDWLETFLDAGRVKYPL